MSAGRTSWWPRDAAEHDRELIVELGDEFGPLGPYTITVLKDLAQQQRSPVVRTGFRSLSKKTHARHCVADDAAAVALQRQVIEYAASIGQLDDLHVDEDGRRFTVRISGLEKDNARGTETLRKAAQRAAKAQADVELDASDDPRTCPEPLGHVPPGEDSSRSVPLNRPNQTNTEEEGARGVGPISGIHSQLPDVLAILRAAPDLDVEDLAVNSALMARQDLDALELARVVASWAHEGGLRNSSANRLLLSAARQIDQREAGKDGARAAAERRGTRHDQGRDEKADRGARNLQALSDLTGGSHAVV